MSVAAVFQSNRLQVVKVERERESAWCLHTNLLFWLVFRISKHNVLDLVTTASDEDQCADPESFVRGGPTLQL